MEPTAGQVLVCGLDMASNSTKISDLMGICPQHDVLWGGLTAREHMQLYGRLKVRVRGRSIVQFVCVWGGVKVDHENTRFKFGALIQAVYCVFGQPNIIFLAVICILSKPPIAFWVTVAHQKSVLTWILRNISFSCGHRPSTAPHTGVQCMLHRELLVTGRTSKLPPRAPPFEKTNKKIPHLAQSIRNHMRTNGLRSFHWRLPRQIEGKVWYDTDRICWMESGTSMIIKLIKYAIQNKALSQTCNNKPQGNGSQAKRQQPETDKEHRNVKKIHQPSKCRKCPAQDPLRCLVSGVEL